MGTKEGLTLRQRALTGLEQSTKMLEVAGRLLRQGKSAEAAKVRQEARTLRITSTLLMAEANKLESPLSTVFHTAPASSQWY